MAISTINSNSMGAASVLQPAVGTGVAGTGPAFSAYLNVDQTIPNNTYTKVQFASEYFDTNSNYDNSTNYRFTPTVAGYYQISSTTQFAASATGIVLLAIYKNGSRYISVSLMPNNVGANCILSGSILVYCNGSTDYIETYVFQSSGGNLLLYGVGSSGGSQLFSGTMVRAA